MMVKHFSVWPLAHVSNTKSYAHTGFRIVDGNGCGRLTAAADVADAAAPARRLGTESMRKVDDQRRHSLRDETIHALVEVRQP